LRLTQGGQVRNKPASNGRYLLTGSANILALPQLAESLVGRMNILTLYPFCTAEATEGLDRIFSMNFSEMGPRNVSLIQGIKASTYPGIFDKEEKQVNLWFEAFGEVI
jgi:hypothetical protein